MKRIFILIFVVCTIVFMACSTVRTLPDGTTLNSSIDESGVIHIERVLPDGTVVTSTIERDKVLKLITETDNATREMIDLIYEE